MSRRGVLGLVLAGTAFLAACDDRSDVPEVLLNPENQPPAVESSEKPARPTTRQLMEGERRVLQLDTLPLLLRVPPEWHIAKAGPANEIVLLQGPTPSGEAQIQIVERPPVPTNKNEYAALIAAAQRGGSEKEEGRLKYREVGPMIVIERLIEGRPISIPILDATGLHQLDDKGDPMMQTSTSMRWTWIALVPQGEMAEWYELNFLLFTKEQYDADREFLESLLSTLRYTGATSARSSTAPAAPTTTPALP